MAATVPADLTITDIDSLTFTYTSHTGRDNEGHGHPAPAHEATQRLTRVRTSAGVDGYCFGGSEEMIATVRRQILGADPLHREAIWYRLLQGQRLERRALDDRNLMVIDCALWDFAGRLTGLPVYKLLGAAREKVPAYASTMGG
jgi:L-alanine-DL-glutamate epimerase-like enolase superfamily enzyme